MAARLFSMFLRADDNQELSSAMAYFYEHRETRIWDLDEWRRWPNLNYRYRSAGDFWGPPGYGWDDDRLDWHGPYFAREYDGVLP